MNTAPPKTEAPKPTGRRYASVSDLLLKEAGSAEVRTEISSLNARTAVVRQLAALRARAGMTQADLAQKIGCTQSRISKIEASKDEDITLGVIDDYVQATGSPIRISYGKPVSRIGSGNSRAKQAACTGQFCAA